MQTNSNSELLENRNVQTDNEELSGFERRLRHCLEFAYRFVLSIFVSFPFGCTDTYVEFAIGVREVTEGFRCLNQPINLDMSDKTAGVILDHQLLRVGYLERLLHSVLGVCGVIIVMKLYGFSTRQRTVWELLKLSMIFGTFAGISRCVQLQHRLYSAFHEIFYIYLNFFLIGICMSLRVTERLPKATSKERSQ